MIFLDTNVIIDGLAEREPFDTAARILFTLADSNKIDIGISALTFPTVAYVLRTQFSQGELVEKLSILKSLVTTVSLSPEIIEMSLNSGFTDFEDAIQFYSALSIGSEMIITRNKKDYRKSTLPVITPEQFLKEF